jgi:predicted  nucleic acid-binding Zn-ribbon protein
MLWKKKSPLKSDEYEDVLKKMVVLATDLDVLKAKISSLETQIRSVRTKVNRSYSDEETETPKNSDPFDWVRKHGVI